MQSQFLHKGFTEKGLTPEGNAVCLIAGQGFYPELLFDGMKRSGVKAFVIGFEGETSESLLAKVDEGQRVVLKVGQIGKLLKALKNFATPYAVMAGQITPRRLFHDLHLDMKAILMLAKLKERNAETIFGAIVTEIEHCGVVLLDARSFMDVHLADLGMMAGPFGKLKQEWIQHGIDLAKKVATLKIGQSVVVSKGTVLGVEGFDGTDGLISRIKDFHAPSPIFVKASHQNHDFRFDVPVFGMKTLELLHASGIEYAALEAKKVLILEKERVLARAKELRITLLGFDADTAVALES